MNTPTDTTVPASADSSAELIQQLKAANAAILYALFRVREDENIRWHMGPGTEAYTRLRDCYCTASRKTAEEVDRMLLGFPLNRPAAAPMLAKIQSAFQEYQIRLQRREHLGVISQEFIAEVQQALSREDA